MNRDPQNKECQKDPIFLLQKRDYVLTHCPDWLGYDGDNFWIEYKNLAGLDTSQWDFIEKGDVIEVNLFKYLSRYEENGSRAAIETWITESVWLNREESERFAKATEYRYPFGWRVYCLSACGDLADILNCASELKFVCPDCGATSAMIVSAQNKPYFQCVECNLVRALKG